VTSFSDQEFVFNFGTLMYVIITLLDDMKCTLTERTIDFRFFILKGQSKLTLESKYCGVKAEACTHSYPRK